MKEISKSKLRSNPDLEMQVDASNSLKQLQVKLAETKKHLEAVDAHVKKMTLAAEISAGRYVN